MDINFPTRWVEGSFIGAETLQRAHGVRMAWTIMMCMADFELLQS